MGRGSGVEVMVGRGMVRIWGYRYRFRHRPGTGLVSGIVQHLASCQCAPQNALSLVQGLPAKDDQALKYPDMKRDTVEDRSIGSRIKGRPTDEFMST